MEEGGEENNIGSKNKLVEKVRANPWILATAVLGVILLFVFLISGGITGSAIITGNAVNTGDASQGLVDFLNGQTGGGVELVSVEDYGDSLYEVTVSYQGDEIPVFMTKDGNYYVQGAVPIVESQEVNEAPEVNVPKSEKPEVELFVMSMCPYGTQIEKGIIPVVELLGDKIDFKLRFVHYAMHGWDEIEDNTIEYCIQKEQPEVLLDHLKCYLAEGDSSACLESVGVDVDKLNDCFDAADSEFDITKNFEDESSWLNGRFPMYNVDLDSTQSYGVQGSPTLVINGQLVSSSRDSQSLLNTVCAGFIDAPEECDESLSSATPSPGFGYSTTTSDTTAQCG